MNTPSTADNIYGVWEESIGRLMSYRYLGCRSKLLSRATSHGTMPLRSDMRTSRGPLAAPLAIAMLDTAGIAVDRLYHAAVTHIVVQIVDNAEGVERLRINGAIVREGRSQVLTEAIIVDQANPHRVIAIGTADWAVLNATPSGFAYIDPGEGVADNGILPPLAQAYHAVEGADGGYRIDQLVPEIGGAMLHHGPILVALEAAALAAATRASPAVPMVRSLEVRFVRPGITAPFSVASATALMPSGSVRVWRSAMTDGEPVGREVARASILTST